MEAASAFSAVQRECWTDDWALLGPLTRGASTSTLRRCPLALQASGAILLLGAIARHVSVDTPARFGVRSSAPSSQETSF